MLRASDGRLVSRSTKQTDRKAALAVALEFERAERKAATLTEAQARKVLNDIMERAGVGETLRCQPIRSFFNGWLESKAQQRSPGTLNRYRKSVREFLKFIGQRADRPLNTLTSRMVENFVSFRLNLGLSPSTVAIDGKVIRTVLNKARRQGLIDVNPAEAVELPACEPVHRGVFTPTEIKLLLDAAEGEWKTLILAAYYTGARLSDCCRMRWADVDLAAGLWHYTAGKTKRTVTVPLHRNLLQHLENLAGVDRPATYVMPNMASKGPGGRHGLSEGFKSIMHKAGVDCQRVEGKGVRTLSKRSFHALRHSFVSGLAAQGVSPELRMALAGHTTEAVHREYTHHELQTLRAAVEKLPGLPT